MYSIRAAASCVCRSTSARRCVIHPASGRTCYRKRVQLVRDQDPGRALQQAADAAVQQVAPHVRVHRRQRVVQQHHVGARVAGARKRDPLPLPAAQIDALLPDLRLVTCNSVRMRIRAMR